MTDDDIGVPDALVCICLVLWLVVMAVALWGLPE